MSFDAPTQSLQCCESWACSDGSSGASCSACLQAGTDELQSRESGVLELAGVEHITVNGTVLDLHWS